MADFYPSIESKALFTFGLHFKRARKANQNPSISFVCLRYVSKLFCFDIKTKTFLCIGKKNFRGSSSP